MLKAADYSRMFEEVTGIRVVHVRGKFSADNSGFLTILVSGGDLLEIGIMPEKDKGGIINGVHYLSASGEDAPFGMVAVNLSAQVLRKAYTYHKNKPKPAHIYLVSSGYYEHKSTVAAFSTQEAAEAYAEKMNNRSFYYSGTIELNPGEDGPTK